MMLDTIALTLDQQQFDVLAPGRFSPSAQGLLSPPYYPLGGRGNFACYQNPTKSDLGAGRYLPRLTLTKRPVRGGFSTTLRIEFSAPKLLLGNNFDELRSRDFERVLDALHRALRAMSVRTTVDTLRAARVSAIHYSKNMAFTDYTTCSMVMKELALIDLSQRLDLSHTDYRNEGHAIRYHTNSFEVTFYDKLKDLQKARISEKRAIERDYGLQRDMFEDQTLLPRQLEVLRMEVRLGNRRKIMNVLKQVGANVEPTFAALFDISIAKQVLMQFWVDVRRQLPIFDLSKTRKPEELLAALATATSGKVRPGALLQRLGCLMLVGSVGMRGAGAIVGRHCSPRTWQRYKRQLSDLQLADSGHFSALKLVDEALREFKPLRMASFQTPATSSGAALHARQSNPSRTSNGI